MVKNLEARNLLNLPPTFFKLLGEVSVRYGQIEHLFTMTIHRATGLSYDDAFAKVENLRARKKIRVEAKKNFRAWALSKFNEEEGNSRADSFDDLIEIWENLWRRRDDVIHCCWSIGRDDDQLTGTRRGDLLKTDGHPFGIKDVRLLARDLEQFVLRLNMATEPTMISVPENEIDAMPDIFTSGWAVPANWETTATAVATYTMGRDQIKPSSG